MHGDFGQLAIYLEWKLSQAISRQTNKMSSPSALPNDMPLVE